jgi:hypothetical protein
VPFGRQLADASWRRAPATARAVPEPFFRCGFFLARCLHSDVPAALLQSFLNHSA